MGAQPQDFGNKLDVVSDKLSKISKLLIPFIEGHRDLVHSGKQGTVELRQASDRIDAFAEEHKKLQKEHNELTALIKKGALAKQDGEVASRHGLGGASLRQALEDHKGFQHFREQVSERDNPKAASGGINVGRFFRPGVDYIPGQVRQASPEVRKLLAQVRASGWNTDTTADIVTPETIEQILLQPRLVNVMTQLIGGQTTSATDQVIRYRETRKPTPGALLDGAIAQAAVTAVLSDTTYITDTYPFNQVRLGVEDVTVTDVNQTTKTITFTPGIIDAAGVADGAIVEFKAVTQTNQGILLPCIVGSLEKYLIPLVKFAAKRKMTNEALNDVTGIGQYIDTIGPLLLGEQREVNMLYGPGTLPTSMTGIMVDSAIPVTPNWSTLDNGTSLWDYVVTMFYDLAKRSVFGMTALMSVERHKDLSILKGTDKRYIWSINQPDGAPRRAFVGDIVMSPWLANPDMMLGDFNAGATIYERQGATTEFGLNGDNFNDDEITVRFKERAGLGIELPTFFQKGVADNEQP